MGYWNEVKRVWGEMADGDFSSAYGMPARQGTGDGGSPAGGTPGGGTPSGEFSYEEWKLIHQKFRNHMGRDPYSMQELKDWWYSF